jgi:two-component system phosphate regulon sensor histidine kinase PhoR
MSHELRSPLAALKGGIDILKGSARDDPKARARFLELMDSEATRMDRLIGDLLSLSAVEFNERVRPAEPVDLDAIVAGAVAALEARYRTAKNRIRFKREAGDWRVPGHEDELTQVFHNLIDNALKYGKPDGEVTISMARVDEVTGISGPAIEVSVHDRGEGIPAQHIPRLTERFYRVDAGRSREKGGTGPGLAIVKHIVNRHRGRLLIVSEPGEGSTFTVCLPAELSPAAAG